MYASIMHQCGGSLDEPDESRPADNRDKTSVGFLDNFTCAFGNSARVMTDGQRDGQADAEPVLDEFKDLVDEMPVPLWHSRKWQYDDVHNEVNQSAVNQAAKDGTAEQEWEFAARQIVDRCRTEGDYEMKRNSQRGGRQASAVRLHPEDAASDGLGNANGMMRTVHGNGIGEVQSTYDQTSHEDGHIRPRMCRG